MVIADTVRRADAGRISHQRLDQPALGAVVAKAVVTIGRDRAAETAAAAVRLARMPPAGPVVALMDDSGPSGPGLTGRCPERSTAGTAKAAADGWALAEELTAAGGDVPAALAAWERRQPALGHDLLARCRAIGDSSQFHGTFRPGDPRLIFGLYAPGN